MRESPAFARFLSPTRSKDDFIREQLKADAVARDGHELARLGDADVVLATGTSTEAMIDCIRGMRPGSTLVVMGYDEKPNSASKVGISTRSDE